MEDTIKVYTNDDANHILIQTYSKKANDDYRFARVCNETTGDYVDFSLEQGKVEGEDKWVGIDMRGNITPILGTTIESLLSKLPISANLYFRQEEKRRAYEQFKKELENKNEWELHEKQS